MNVAAGRRLQGAAGGLGLLGYAALSHYCNSQSGIGGRADLQQLGALLAMVPVTLLVMMSVWRWMRPRTALLATAAFGALMYRLWPLIQGHFSLLYCGEESVFYALLGLTFSRSLRPPRIALCTRWADRIHGPLSAREVSYTRRVTLAWAVFFFAVAATSVLLFLAATPRVWSIYINFCVLPLVGAMLVLEYCIRLQVLPEAKRSGIAATVRVFLTSPR